MRFPLWREPELIAFWVWLVVPTISELKGIYLRDPNLSLYKENSEARRGPLTWPNGTAHSHMSLDSSSPKSSFRDTAVAQEAHRDLKLGAPAGFRLLSISHCFPYCKTLYRWCQVVYVFLQMAYFF